MLIRVLLGLAMLTALPLWSQVDEDAAESVDTSLQSTQMLVPAPVSTEAYPRTAGAETHLNYVGGGIGFSVGYIDSLYPGGTAGTLSETIISVQPIVSLNRSTDRQQTTISYNSGYTFFHPTSVLNEDNQNASVAFQYRLSPRVTLVASDSLLKASSLFGHSGSYGVQTVSGSLQTTTGSFVAPFANQLENTGSGELRVQTGPKSMLGGSATGMILHYLDPAEVTGLSDSHAWTASGFYNQRVSEGQYLGGKYEYSRMVSDLTHDRIETLTNTFSGFYTIYFSQKFSISFSGGPEEYRVSRAATTTSSAWTPAATASIGWQGTRANLAASYQRQVDGAGGLSGVFKSNTANTAVR